MIQEFIPYQQALELKKLGFDEPCLYHWHNSCKTHPFTNEVYNPNCRPKTNSGIKDIGEENHVWSAPTFSQAFRFFREKHTLYHDIKMFGDWDKPQFSYIVSGRTMTNPAHMWHYEDENSYEEAELACLVKLIEIVKTK